MFEIKKDLAKHWGKSYVMEAVRFQGTPPMITALASGDLEIANLAYSTLGLAIQNAGLSDLRIIADEFQDGVPGYYSNEFFVRKDSGINKIEDLKGKVLATNAQGSGIDIAMKAALKKHGLVDKRDYTVIEAPFPTHAALLKDKKADLVSGVPPFSFNPVFKTRVSVCSIRPRASAARNSCSGPCASRSSTSTVRRWSTSWKTCCGSSAGTSTRRTTRR
jgi:NitT/TauT family transport system substrate-binding protein